MKKLLRRIFFRQADEIDRLKVDLEVAGREIKKLHESNANLATLCRALRDVNADLDRKLVGGEV
jgi:hypothetical protein